MIPEFQFMGGAVVLVSTIALMFFRERFPESAQEVLGYIIFFLAFGGLLATCNGIGAI